MSRYLLFAGDTHYPRGGATDLRGVFDTLDVAISSLGPDGRADWAHVARLDDDGVVIVAVWLPGASYAAAAHIVGFAARTDGWGLPVGVDPAAADPDPWHRALCEAVGVA